MTDKVMTMHPGGKQGVNLDKKKYNLIRAAILSTLDDQEEVHFMDLAVEVEERLTADFDGSIAWYVTTVKLDLEARGLIERITKSSPQRIRLSS